MYKIGDKIRIKHDLQASIDRYKIGVTYDMEKYRGQITTIKEVYREASIAYCRIDLDHQYWAWTDDMFEPADEDIDLQALLDLI